MAGLWRQVSFRSTAATKASIRYPALSTGRWSPAGSSKQALKTRAPNERRRIAFVDNARAAVPFRNFVCGSGFRSEGGLVSHTLSKAIDCVLKLGLDVDDSLSSPEIRS
jgi:hypothetical protein